MKKNILFSSILLLVSVLISSCGGGGDVPSKTTTTTTTSSGSNAKVAALTVVQSAASLKADGTSKITLILSALTAGSAYVENAKIDLAATGGVILSASSVTTPLAAAATATTAAIGPTVEVTIVADASDQTKRTATITASCANCAAAPKTVQIQVTGASVTITQPSSGTPNLIVGSGSQRLSVLVRDALGNPIAGKSVQFATASPNVLAIDNPLVPTNSSGIASVEVSGKIIGDASITVTSMDVSATQAFKVGAATSVLAINSPANNKVVETDAEETITIAAPDAAKLSISTSLGFIDDVKNKISDVVAGSVTVKFKSTNAGTATITVVDTASTSRVVNLNLVVSPPPSKANKLILNASKTSLPYKSDSGTVSSIEITARAIFNNNGTDQYVANVPVDFTMSGGPGAGEYISPARAYTDATGSAKITFFAGSAATISNGILISASISDKDGLKVAATGASPSSNSVAVTIGGKALSVAIGSSSVIKESDDKTLYLMSYSVMVTDANNNPVSGQQVTLRMRPIAFSTGANCAKAVTAPAVNRRTFCSEDLNGNGSLDANEDGVRILLSNDLSDLSLCQPGSSPIPSSMNKSLTPSNSDGGAIPSFVTTDVNGAAGFTFTYLKASSLWLVNELTAIVSADGTETTKSVPFRLVASEDDTKGDTCKIPDSPYIY